MALTLDDVDFAAAWREMNSRRRRPDDAAYWDSRARDFSENATHSDYASEFIKLMQAKEGESIFDMGCGAGTLSVPLAKRGHLVHSADFSGKMLEQLHRYAHHEGVAERIASYHVSWAGDWEQAGIPVCDVAFASRSIVVDDLEAALIKLNSRARRRACITLPARNSPRYDAVLWEAVGRARTRTPEPLYALGILFKMGYIPQMQMIVTPKIMEAATRDELVDRARSSLHEMTEDEERLFRQYCEQHIIEHTTPVGEAVWTRDYEQNTYWAFISWNMRDA